MHDWYFRNFIIVITGCVNDWIFGFFSNFRALCESMHDFSLSGVPDNFYRNKISSGGDLSHYSSASLY